MYTVVNIVTIYIYIVNMYTVTNIVDNIYLYSQYVYSSHCFPSAFRKNITILSICKCFVFI